MTSTQVQDETASYDERYKDALALRKVLNADIETALNRISNEDHDSSRRDVVRTVFETIDGVLWSTQDELLRLVGHNPSETERAFLREQKIGPGS
jgi:hypothetical protein